MKLLDLAAYRDLIAGAAVPVTATPAAIAKIIAYAAKIWKTTGLAARKLTPRDLTRSERRDAATLFHLRAFPRRQPGTSLVVAAADDGTAVQGHILIAAPDGAPRLIAPSLGDDAPATIPVVRRQLARLDAALRDPFAVVELADGTYMQTLAEADGRFVLEHQLVTTQCHYEVPRPVDRATMIAAMVSYAGGDGAWIDLVPWRRQRL